MPKYASVRRPAACSLPVNYGDCESDQWHPGKRSSGTQGEDLVVEVGRKVRVDVLCLTETWLSVGNVSTANRLRHSNKLRLNHPLSVLFGDGVSAARKHLVDPLAGQVPSMGESVHLQSVRATSSSADEVLLNLLHVYGEKELPAHLHQPQNLDLAALLKPFRPDLTALNETSLNGMVSKEEAETERRVWKTASPPSSAARAEQPEAGGALLIRPFEFKTFLAKEF